MISEIDFLPESYKLARARRKRKQWRVVAMLVALLMIAAGSIRQRQASVTLAGMRDRLLSNVDRMSAQVKGLPELNDELSRLDSQANVVSLLRCKLPPSRIMQVVTATLPEHVTLTQCRVSVELLPKKPGAATGRRENAPSPTDAKPVNKLPSQKDLESLLKRHDDCAQFVSLNGVAPDDSAIAQYLAALKESGLFSDVTLEFTDVYAASDQPVRRFGVRVRLTKVEPWRLRKPDSRVADPTASSTAAVPPTNPTNNINRRPS